MMRPIVCLACLAFLLSGLPSWAQTTRPERHKKLIEFGWDEPDAAFMRKHIAAMEQMPFDGTVFHIDYIRPDGSIGRFMDDCWGSQAIPAASVASALTDLKATKFTSFTHNFFRFDVCPGDVGWFDDFGAVTHNAQLAAQVASVGKAAGILFDIEQYRAHLWDYRVQNGKDPRPLDDYAKQVRQRGRELMRAFQKGYPNVTVFLTFGYSLPWSDLNNVPDRTKLATVDYGLLAPFLDGMFDAAVGQTTIVDGYELSYGYKTPAQFDEAVASVKQKLLPLVGDRAKYLRHLSMGFGLWVDYDWRKLGWNNRDVAKNYFTPHEFQSSLTAALKASDGYVWVYTETPKWWTPPAGAPSKLPPAYIDAVRAARAQVR